MKESHVQSIFVDKQYDISKIFPILEVDAVNWASKNPMVLLMLQT